MTSCQRPGQEFADRLTQVLCDIWKVSGHAAELFYDESIEIVSTYNNVQVKF